MILSSLVLFNGIYICFRGESAERNGMAQQFGKVMVSSPRKMSSWDNCIYLGFRIRLDRRPCQTLGAVWTFLVLHHFTSSYL